MREGARRLSVVSAVLAWWLCALVTSACLQNPAVTCKNGQICAPGNFCDDAHGGCATSSQIVTCGQGRGSRVQLSGRERRRLLRGRVLADGMRQRRAGGR